MKKITIKNVPIKKYCASSIAETKTATTIFCISSIFNLFFNSSPYDMDLGCCDSYLNKHILVHYILVPFL